VSQNLFICSASCLASLSDTMDHLNKRAYAEFDNMVQLKPPHILGFDGGATFSLLRWQISLLQHDCKRGLHVRSYRCPEERYDAISRSFGSSSSSSSSEPRRVQLDGHANSHIQSSKELHRADYGRYHHVKHNCRPTHQISWCAKNHWNNSKHRCSRSPGLDETI
jgi:hypothetical protein